MIGIIDYGLGNIQAFKNLLVNNSISTRIVKNQDDLDGLNCAILPGVGSFDNAIRKLRSQSYFEKLNNSVLNDKLPIVGICVGMQIMLDSSEEGLEKGLSWIKGSVKKFDPTSFIVPHMGWNIICETREECIFKNLDNEREFYFLHSYYAEVEEKYVISQTKHGHIFCSSFKKKNIYGIQFHPEKSHNNGANILKNFYNQYA